ncbi:MAG: 50S ribosomal protein L10 [Oscillospiraceae bacterium]
MPNAKALAEKQAIVEKLAGKLQNSAAGVFVDYKGINVSEDTTLRAELRKSNVDYAVVKNTLVRIAADKVGFNELDPILNGNTALAVCADDPVAPAKILCDFAKKAGETKFVIKAGFVEGRVISAEEVKSLASLPPREVLIATVLGTMNAPLTGLVSVLIANIRGLACALNAIAEKKA